MKVFGIIFFVFAALNLVVAFIAAVTGAVSASGQKFSAAFMLGIIGGILYYFGQKKKKEE